MYSIMSSSYAPCIFVYMYMYMCIYTYMYLSVHTIISSDIIFYVSTCANTHNDVIKTPFKSAEERQYVM